MKSGKLSPLIVSLMFLLAGTVVGMAYFVIIDEVSVVDDASLMFAVASMVLVAVLVVPQASMEQQMNEQLNLMRQEIALLRNDTLENVPSGKAASWVAQAGSARAEVTPLKTYRTTSDQYCREYEERIEDTQGVEIRRGIACRVAKGSWPDLTQLLPPENLKSETGKDPNGTYLKLKQPM